MRGARREIDRPRRRAAFGLSEPQAGSDVMGMRTKAVLDGDDWILTGTKCWMSGVAQADWYCVFAKTGPVDSRAHDSITAFVVERGWEGVSVGRLDKKMGVKGVDTGELVFFGYDVFGPPFLRSHVVDAGGVLVQTEAAREITRDEPCSPSHLATAPFRATAGSVCTSM